MNLKDILVRIIGNNVKEDEKSLIFNPNATMFLDVEDNSWLRMNLEITLRDKYAMRPLIEVSFGRYVNYNWSYYIPNYGDTLVIYVPKGAEVTKVSFYNYPGVKPYEVLVKIDKSVDVIENDTPEPPVGTHYYISPLSVALSFIATFSISYTVTRLIR